MYNNNAFNFRVVNPCASIRCRIGSACVVYGCTGFCQYSCEIANGGCKPNQNCSLVPVQCIREPCPPVVKCTDCKCNVCAPDIYRGFFARSSN